MAYPLCCGCAYCNASFDGLAGQPGAPAAIKYRLTVTGFETKFPDPPGIPLNADLYANGVHEAIYYPNYFAEQFGGGDFIDICKRWYYWGQTPLTPTQQSHLDTTGQIDNRRFNVLINPRIRATDTVQALPGARSAIQFMASLTQELWIAAYRLGLINATDPGLGDGGLIFDEGGIDWVWSAIFNFTGAFFQCIDLRTCEELPIVGVDLSSVRPIEDDSPGRGFNTRQIIDPSHFLFERLPA
jgi:hypothetical protein